MEKEFYAAAAQLVDAHIVAQAQQVASSNAAPARRLVESKKLPEAGWREEDIEALLRNCAAMDSNNFGNNVGVGEREARVISPLVRRRHFGLAHGVGRSGDIAAVQPKAAGSSLLAKLSNHLALDALREAGNTEFEAALVLPCATGLSLALCLLSVRNRPGNAAKKKVLWCRIDQKSCFKGILLAGLEPVVVSPTRDRGVGSPPDHARLLKKKKAKGADAPPPPPPPSGLGDELLTDLPALEARLDALGDDVLAVVTTTSCFAPRAPGQETSDSSSLQHERADDVAAVARLCAAREVAHVVNNAYGVQCARSSATLSRARARVGRCVDLVVQSTDKNFLVPVGGAVVASPDAALVAEVGRGYPGRASATPSQDLLRRELQRARRALDDAAARARLANDKVTKFGSMLFTRCVSGTRVVAPGKTQVIGPEAFSGFGRVRGRLPHRQGHADRAADAAAPTCA
ncbi:selenium transferase [Aureococcus anophagefferens]|uniref:O-phosphoseryl-tRNA(Sec) selenium transferase n=1 Tax=Aureococcus anophagefferens TaxID=44056 RepID=A0ABR1G150_AURAN